MRIDEMSAGDILAHRDGDTMVIDIMMVPVRLRRQGVGRKTYEAWEQRLPKDIRLVKLDAIDADGSGDSTPFWTAMGFRPVYASDDPDFAVPNELHKGVNGHPTPEPMEYDPDDHF